jgi:mannose-6-phosphate isomerase
MTNLNDTFMHLAPFVVEKLWGGHKLAHMKGLNVDGMIGETWEVSTLIEGPSSFNGKPLNESINHLRYLIKFIDTTDYLSVQVHPNDEYAAKVENSQGKTECWFILDADEGAGIYLGFREGVTKSGFEKAINAKEDLASYLCFYPVKRGDFFYVPAGSIHAIGKGVTLAEVQQSSGVTYRVWDWNRLEKNGQPRKLDVSKALDVLNFQPQANKAEFFRFNSDSFIQTNLEFISHPDFHVSLIKLKPDEKFAFEISKENNYSILNLSGECDLKLHGQKTFLQKYHSLMIKPGSFGVLEIQSMKETILLVVR